jgi:membrane protein required for colicin V production
MWIDVVWVILVVVAAWKGWTQGFIISLFSALAWGVGIVGAIKLCTVTSKFLQDNLDVHSEYLPVIAFIVVFLIIALFIFLVGKALEKLIDIAFLGTLNKLCGSILRVAIYTVLFAVFLWLLNEAGLLSPAVKSQSKIYSTLNNVSDYLIGHLADYTPAVKSVFKELEDFFEDLSKKIRKNQ